MQATISPEVILFQRPPQTLKVSWDNFPTEEGDNSVIEVLEGVIPVFPTEAGASKAVLDTARRWTDTRGWGEKNTVFVSSPEVPEENLFRDLKVIDFVVRDHGGRAWKVIDSKNRMFDVREDVLHEAMLHGRFQNGRLEGMEFQWARVGSQMKLVRVGSKFHQACKVASTRNAKSKIKDLEVGAVYRNRKGEYLLWLGKEVQKVETIGELYERGRVSYPEGWWFQANDSYSYLKMSFLPYGEDANKNLGDYKVAYWLSLEKVKSPPASFVEKTSRKESVREVVERYNLLEVEYATRDNRPYGEDYSRCENVRNAGRFLTLASDPGFFLQDPKIKDLVSQVLTDRFFKPEKGNLDVRKFLR